MVPVVLGLAVRVVPVVPVVLGLAVRVVPVVLGLAVRVDLVGLMGPVAPVARLLLGLVVRVVPVVLAPVVLAPAVLVVLGLVARVDLVGLMGRMGLVVLDQMAPVAPVGLVVLGRTVLEDLVGPVDQDQMGLAAQVDPGDPVGLNMAVLVGLVVPVDLSTAARVVPVDLSTAVPVGRAVLVDPAGLVVPVDPDTVGRVARVAPAGRHRRHMCNGVTMTAVARSGVVRGTHRTASALPVTGLLHLRPRTASGGMAGLLPERRRPTGTVRRLPEVGMGRHPPVAGIRNGTDRRTISVGGRRTMARSTTTDTTPRRFSTRCSVAGASGSSVRGFRCTDPRPA